MELIEVDPLDAQRLERGLKLLADSRGGEVLGAIEEAIEVMAELGGHEPERAVVAAEGIARSEEHTSELQSLRHLVCRPLLGKKQVSRDGCAVFLISASVALGSTRRV